MFFQDNPILPYIDWILTERLNIERKISPLFFDNFSYQYPLFWPPVARKGGMMHNNWSDFAYGAGFFAGMLDEPDLAYFDLLQLN